jgi:DNA-binding HxlR family transcriptional regulator
VPAPTPDPLESRELRGIARALDAVGDRWSLAVVAALLDGPLRYGELQQRLGRVAPNVLAKRLRDLEDERLLVARPYSERPPRFEYELTEGGAELAGAIRLLADWGARHAGEEGDAPRHAVCDTPLEARWFCPSCEVVVSGDGVGGEDDLVSV